VLFGESKRRKRQVEENKPQGTHQFVIMKRNLTDGHIAGFLSGKKK
jgi:hypothetical protein